MTDITRPSAIETPTDVAAGSDPIICDLSAIPALQRATHFALARRLLFADDRQVREVESGLAFELRPEQLADVARFIENERRCCPHLRFALEIPPRNGTLTLRVTGPGAREELWGAASLGMKTVAARSPRRLVWWIVVGVAVVAAAAYALPASWRGVTVGGVSVVALLACALPCTIPLIVARLVARR
jgi:hypothetical protein